MHIRAHKYKHRHAYACVNDNTDKGDGKWTV